ncbi:MAG: site-2 protease family protein [Kiritimatiellales bacterium]|nr:site-2 protease family protein [Kiritimatiellales bacterium]
MNGNSISLGRVFGIPIRVHFLLLIALPFIMTFFSTPSVPLRLLGAIGLFASVALHEIGHSVVAQAKGSYIQEIVLYPFGGAAKISNIPKRPIDEILVALAGPAVSLLLGILGVTAGFRMLAAMPEATHYPLVLELGAINVALFVFNLLPVFPMDGGRVLRALLASKKSRVEATRIAATIGKYFCIFFVVYGLVNMRFLLAFIGGYIYFAGQQEYRMVLMENQADRFSGYREGQIDVEVSPPPYAGHASKTESLTEKLRRLFRS